MSPSYFSLLVTFFHNFDPHGRAFVRSACSTTVTVTMNFGSQTWTISPQDFNLGAIDNTGKMCVGGVFDLDAGTNGAAGDPSSGSPAWVIGDTFLVRISLKLDCFFSKILVLTHLNGS